MTDRADSVMPTGVAPVQASWSARLRWQAFRQMERLSATTSQPVLLPQGSVRPALWIFVSTIGELNAINPFLHQLIEQMPELQLVLLSDRQIYRTAYLAQYPNAEVVEISVDNLHAPALAKIRPPQLFVIAEIPCFPADAPCRLPYGYLYEAKQAGAVTSVVNGWLYGYAPSCRIDAIERRMLGRDYLQLLDVLCVQNQDVAHALIDRGAQPERVHVTGNIKFDAIDFQPRPLAQTRSPQLLASLQQGKRPVIVAGCVTDDAERDLVLDAFVLLRQSRADAVLVLAPRHPEQPEVMSNLMQALLKRQLPFLVRSSSSDEALRADEGIVLLDTMGELRDFYAVASVAHVGRDHNLLEALAYGKPVTLRSGWEPTYPSYPVFNLVGQLGLIMIHDESAQLSGAWRDCLIVDPVATKIMVLMERQRGASRRCLLQLKPHFSSAAASPWTNTSEPLA